LPADVAKWLVLRDSAMAGTVPSARAWNHEDFHAEMTSKSWWRDDWSWVAISTEGSATNIIGAVTLALRESANASIPVVHWLLVDPLFRRRGIARLLMSNLESAARGAGYGEVQLETHAGWQAAVAFYQSIGYAALRDRSPR